MLLTFSKAVWTWVRTWTAATLEKAGERVADVQGEDDVDEVDEPTPAQAAATPNMAPNATEPATTGTAEAAEPESRKTQ